MSCVRSPAAARTDRPLSGPGNRAHRHRLAQGRLQPGLRLLPRDHAHACRQDPRQLLAASRPSRTPSRYITPELKEYEEKVLSAEEKSKQREYELFLALRDQVAAQTQRLLQTGTVLAHLDVLASFADLAVSRQYVRPVLCDEPTLVIKEAGIRCWTRRCRRGPSCPTTCASDRTTAACGSSPGRTCRARARSSGKSPCWTPARDGQLRAGGGGDDRHHRSHLHASRRQRRAESGAKAPSWSR